MGVCVRSGVHDTLWEGMVEYQLQFAVVNDSVVAGVRLK